MDTEVLRERADLSAVRVDREGSIIRNVKLIGAVSKNGREYLPEALRKAVEHYIHKPVNVDHGTGGKSRSYRDRIGTIISAEYRDGGIFGAIRFNPKHALAEQLAWDAENAPESVGLSHDAVGRTVRRDGKTIVERIESVRSVDLVADPATTGGLFESDQVDGDRPMRRKLTAAEVREEIAAIRAMAAARKSASTPAYAGPRGWGDGMPGTCPPAAASERHDLILRESIFHWRTGQPATTRPRRLSAIVAGWRN